MTATFSVNGLPKTRKPRVHQEDHDALFIARLAQQTFSSLFTPAGPGIYKIPSRSRSGREHIYDAVEDRCNCEAGQFGRTCWAKRLYHAFDPCQGATSAQTIPAAFSNAWEGDDTSLQLPAAGGICAACGAHALTLVDDGICPACSFFDDGTRAFRPLAPASVAQQSQAPMAVQASEPTKDGDDRPPALIAASILLAAVSPPPPPTRRCPRCGNAEALPGAILCATCQDRRTAPALTLPEPPSCDDVHWCVGGCGARALPGRLHCRTSTLGRGYCGAARDAYEEAVWA